MGASPAPSACALAGAPPASAASESRCDATSRGHATGWKLVKKESGRKTKCPLYSPRLCLQCGGSGRPGSSVVLVGPFVTLTYEPREANGCGASGCGRESYKDRLRSTQTLVSGVSNPGVTHSSWFPSWRRALGQGKGGLCNGSRVLRTVWSLSACPRLGVAPLLHQPGARLWSTWSSACKAEAQRPSHRESGSRCHLSVEVGDPKSGLTRTLLPFFPAACIQEIS
jgi:hypothetical protein